ncbi:unnamed protein product [Peniophora sp. CBMAI 1063]|nr:unnamed protein product [Peniophora sp. CBMAI 1063]
MSSSHARYRPARQPVTSAQRAGCPPDCERHDRFEHAIMMTRLERQRERLPSPDHDAPPVFGPANPYDPLTRDGQIALERRERPEAATAVDRWLDATRNLWHRADPRLMTTELFAEEVKCEVHVRTQHYVYPGDPSSPFASDYHTFWTLLLRLVLPESSGIRAGLRSSPLAILEEYNTDMGWDHPDWAEYMNPGEVYSCAQPRFLAGDCFATLATSPANIREGYSDAMLRWAQDVSPIRQARRRVRRERQARGSGDGLRRSSRSARST